MIRKLCCETEPTTLIFNFNIRIIFLYFFLFPDVDKRSKDVFLHLIVFTVNLITRHLHSPDEADCCSCWFDCCLFRLWIFMLRGGTEEEKGILCSWDCLFQSTFSLKYKHISISFYSFYFFAFLLYNKPIHAYVQGSRLTFYTSSTWKVKGALYFWIYRNNSVYLKRNSPMVK